MEREITMVNEELLVTLNGGPKPLPQRKTRSLLVNFFVSSLLMAVTVCFLFSPAYFAISGDNGKGDSPIVGDERLQREKCDLFSGEWIPNPGEPAYTNETCEFVQSPQNCMKNGRPDNLYLHWRWKPYGCDLPQFNAAKFMKAMRNKSWGLIGDSILRNQLQSLICLLRKVEKPVLIYHDTKFQSVTWYFSSHNFTLATIWSPLLVKAETSENSEGKSDGPIQLHLDVLDTTWTSEYHKYDYIIISGGQWFLKTMIFLENSTAIGCHNCEQNLRELGVGDPYRKVLQLALHFIVNSDHKPLVIYRTWTSSHFEFGEWFSGGVCNRTMPYKEGQYDANPTDHEMRDVEIEEFEKAAAIGSKSGISMKLMDISHLSLLRPDGHPGPYRTFHPFAKNKNAKVQNDCLHWCLPGPIDAWNDIMIKMLSDEGDLTNTS